MKIAHIIVFALTLTFIASAEERKKSAPPPPSQMSELDLARLDAADAHIKLITGKAERDLAPYADVVAKIFAAYQIDPVKLQAGAITIDSKTGKITRQQEAPPPPKTLAKEPPLPKPLPVRPPRVRADVPTAAETQSTKQPVKK